MSFVEIAKTDEITAGQMKGIKKDEKNILVTNIAGKYYAINGKVHTCRGRFIQGEIGRQYCDLPEARFKIRCYDGKSHWRPGKAGGAFIPSENTGKQCFSRLLHKASILVLTVAEARREIQSPG